MAGFELDDIIIGCKAGISRYQTSMYEMFRNKMFLLVRRYVNCPYIAEEVMNDGFVRAYAKIQMFEGTGSFEGWLRKIVFHAVADAVKNHPEIATEKKSGWGRRGSRVEADEFGMDRMLAKRGIYDTMVDRFGCDELDIMIERLPKTTGRALKLYLNGGKHSDIGRELGITEGTSKWHVSTAKSILKKVIIRSEYITNFVK